MKRLLLCLLVPLLSHCGFTDEGSGSNTLEVEALVRYRVDQNQSAVEITVVKGTQDVIDAEVTLKDADSNTTFTIPPDGSGTGFAYRAGLEGYHRKLELRIQRGADNLNAKLEGPGPHVVEEPKNGQVLDSGDVGGGLEVKWTTDDGIKADEVRIILTETDYDVPLTEDKGKHVIPGSEFLIGDEELRVIRRNNVNLAGGVGASVFRIEYEVQNDLVITP